MSDRVTTAVLQPADATPEKLADYANLCVNSSFVPIHPNYLKYPDTFKAFKEIWPDIVESRAAEESTTPDDSASSKGESRQRGQNKKRKTNIEAVKRAKANQLCSNIAATGNCSFTNCKWDHDISQRLALVKSSSELTAEPVVVDGIDLSSYSVLSECPSAARGLPCVFGINCIAHPLSHCDPSTGANIFDGKPVTSRPTNEFNYMTNVDLLKHLRDKGLHKRRAKPTISEAFSWETEIDSTVLTKINHDRSKLKSILSGKLILAPLTTVGNMPFRRLCISQGCDATHSEMVLATSICQMKKGDLALMRRHPSEKYFGVQIAGGFSDCVEQAIDILNASDITYDWLDLNAGCPIEGMQNRGSGCFLLSKIKKLNHICQTMALKANAPITLKTRTGTITKDENITHTVLHELMAPINGLAGITLHGRTAKQRYSKSANWEYIGDCKKYLDYLHSHNGEPREVFPDIVENYQFLVPDLETPLFMGNGDIIDFEQYNILKDSVDAVMIGRGALIKPWIFREIKEQARLDVTASERLDILKTLARYGLELWGSDAQGVERTRRFFLEELSFFHRYIPIGIMEKPALYSVQHRPPEFVARSELETLLASDNSADWIRISELFLGKVDDEFTFVPKHKSSSY